MNITNLVGTWSIYVDCPPRASADHDKRLRIATIAEVDHDGSVTYFTESGDYAGRFMSDELDDHAREVVVRAHGILAEAVMNSDCHDCELCRPETANRPLDLTQDASGDFYPDTKDETVTTDQPAWATDPRGLPPAVYAAIPGRRR